MKHFKQQIIGIAGHLGRSLFGRSDYSRWSNTDNLRDKWDGRTEALAQFIEPGSRVLELGAGRCRLRSFLPDNCDYTPSDIVDRGSDTFICDLNKRPLPSLASFAPDIVVMSGVLEYVNEPADVVHWLGAHTRHVAMSYSCVRGSTSRKERVRIWAQRSQHGWVNHFDESELLALFADSGFACHNRKPWEAHSLFDLHRKTPPA